VAAIAIADSYIDELKIELADIAECADNAE
jgi:hypothetical protein